MSMPMSSKTSKGFERVSTFDPQQQQLFQQLIQNLLGGGAFQSGQGYLNQLLSGDPEATKAFEAPYLRQFQEQTIPGLAERFSGGFGIPGAASAQSSSAFQQALGQAGAGLQENLAGLREGMRFQAANKPFEQLMQALGLNTQAFMEKQRPWWQGALTGLAGGLGQGLGMGIGGGITGGLGAAGSALTGIGGLFGPKQQGSTINKFGQITGKF